MQKGYEAAAEDYGVTLMTSNTNNDQAKEADLINTYVNQGIDGIAIAPLNETSSMQALETAYDAGLEIAVGNTKLEDSPFVCGGYTSDNYNPVSDTHLPDTGRKLSPGASRMWKA